MNPPKRHDLVRLIGDAHVSCDRNDITLRGSGKVGRVVHVDPHPTRPFITVETEDDHERWGFYWSGTEAIILEEAECQENGTSTPGASGIASK